MNLREGRLDIQQTNPQGASAQRNVKKVVNTYSKKRLKFGNNRGGETANTEDEMSSGVDTL